MLRNNRLGMIMAAGIICMSISVTGISGCADNGDNTNSIEKTGTSKEASTNRKIDPNKTRDGKNGDEASEKDENETTIDIFNEKGSELLLNTEALSSETKEVSAGDIKEIVEVGRGDYTHKLNAMAERYYLDKYYETVKMPDIKFIKYKVSEGDYVKKGDTIFTYEAEIDEYTIKQMETDIIQKEKDYTAGYDSRKAEITKAKHELKTLKDSNDIKLKKLEIKKLQQALKEDMLCPFHYFGIYQFEDRSE